MKMEHTMASLLAAIRTNREEMRAGQEHLKEEMMAKLDARDERMMSRMDSHLETMEAAVDIFEERLNEMDTTDFEGNREKSDCKAEQQDAPKEETAGENIGALVDRYGDRHLAVGLCRQPKKRTQGDAGSRQKLAAARGRMSRRAVPASRMGHGRRGTGRDNVVRGAHEGRKFRKRRRSNRNATTA
jgi:hypothetical protein